MASYVDAKALEAEGGGIPSGNSPSGGPAGPDPEVYHVQPKSIGEKKILDAYVLALGLGFLGAHHFYLRRPGFGVLYLFTFGLLGVGYIVDWFRVPFLVKEANRKLHSDGQSPPQKSLADAYILWFPLGLLGLHHFYLRRWGWGFAYLFTFGLLGVGWLIDGFRMKCMVDETNRRLEERGHCDPTISLSNAYVLCLFPLTGLLGVHHYYLRRPAFGVLYTFTLGLLGVGWLVDICRLKCLVDRVNKKIVEGDDGKKHLDDAYLCLFPLGFLGLHHFYLRRPGWGVLYLFTFGVMGIGWIVDFFRLPCLVNDVNTQNSDERAHLTSPSINTVVSPGLVNPAMLVAPGAYPPSYQGGYPYPQGPAGQYPALPPGYPPAGLDSFSSIASSDVGHEGGVFRPGYQQPPSYQEATGDRAAHNASAPPPPRPN